MSDVGCRIWDVGCAISDSGCRNIDLGFGIWVLSRRGGMKFNSESLNRAKQAQLNPEPSEALPAASREFSEAKL